MSMCAKDAEKSKMKIMRSALSGKYEEMELVDGTKRKNYK